MTTFTLLCPVCNQEVRCAEASGRYVMHAHFRVGTAAPCSGSSRTREEAKKAAAAEKRGLPPPSLFD